MNVLLAQMIVIIHALTLLVVMCVIVMLDMYLILMDRLVLVSIIQVIETRSIIHAYVDDDECSRSNGGCQQTCNNNEGSYTCACLTGFELDDDDHGCSGIRNKPD